MPSRRITRSGPRRKLIWARMTPAVSSLTIGVADGAESQDLLQTFRTQAGITAGPVGLTVMRMRFNISSAAVSSPVTGLAPQYIWGVRVMDTTEAGLAEVNAVPYSPVSDPHADWMCFEPFGVLSTNGGTAGNWIVEHSIDVRSMRKFQELGQTLVGVLAIVPPTGGTGVTHDIKVTSSVLLALP